MTQSEQSVLELRDVTFRRNGKQILHGITFSVGEGEQWAMLGPNGAGKSTILGMCGAETHPTTGTVHVLGRQLGRVELQLLRRTIGHVNPRHPLRTPLTLREVVLTGITGTIEIPLRWVPAARDVARVDALIDTLGLHARAADRWPTLSQGERGRALIARALVCEPRLLLLDEPSTGLDVAAREQLLTTLDALVVTHPELASILVTHHLEELPTTMTHALLIADGRVVAQGSAREVITTEAISTAFGHPIEVRADDGRWIARAVRTQHHEQSASMRAEHITPNLKVANIEAAKSFYTDFLGLTTEEFNMGWVARYASPATGAHVQLVTGDSTSPVDSVVSVHAADVDAAYADALRLGYEIVHPLTTEGWGVRRFLVRAPDGNVINVVQHRE